MRPTVRLDDHAREGLGTRTVIASHDLPADPLFADDALADILDGYPADRLVALTMGDDPQRSDDNERVDHRSLSGRDLLEAVRRGRLWLNITGIDVVDPRYRAITDALYEGVHHEVPAFEGIETHATLLISSPGAMVYFHVDGPPSFLWHIRGRKRLWVYPALDERFLPRPLLEDVFAGARQEYVPYRSDFDAAAEVFDLEPGQVAMWPQNAPHRVTNHDSLNVSLVTDHYTIDGRRRARVYVANRFLRTRAHLPAQLLGTATTGPVATSKVAIHKAGRLLHLDHVAGKAHRPPVRCVDLASPSCLREITPAG